jgi:hypothetical protein
LLSIYLKHFGRDRPADVKSIEGVFRAKEEKKEAQRKKKELRKEAGPSDQETRSFSALESLDIYTGDVRNRKHQLLVEGGLKVLPFSKGFAFEKA